MPGYLKARLYSSLRDERTRRFFRTEIKYRNRISSLDEPVKDENNNEKKHKYIDILWQDIGETPQGICPPLNNTSSLEMSSAYNITRMRRALDEWLSDEVNNKIFECLNNGSETQKEIALKVGISQQAVSERFKKLKDLLKPTNSDQI